MENLKTSSSFMSGSTTDLLRAEFAGHLQAHLLMDLFTQSVDASLWRSRCGEEPVDEDDPAAAAEADAPVTAEVSAPPPSTPPTLFVADGPAASAALAALCVSTTPLATLRGAALADTAVELCTEGPLRGSAVALLSRGVQAHRAFAWARAALGASRARSIVAVASDARATFRGKLVEGAPCVHALVTAAGGEAAAGLPPLQEPAFVTGAAAAVLSEAEWADTPGVCLLAVLERANFGADEVEQIASAVCRVAAALGGAGGGVGKDVSERIRTSVKKSAVSAHDSIYL